MEDILPALQSELPSWQMNGDGSGVLGNSTQSSQKSCPNNWQNSLMWKSLSWSLKVHVMKLRREMLKVTMLPLLKQKSYLDSKIQMTGCTSHQKASLQTLSLVWVIDFAEWHKHLRNITAAKVFLLVMILLKKASLEMQNDVQPHQIKLQTQDNGKLYFLRLKCNLNCLIN